MSLLYQVNISQVLTVQVFYVSLYTLVWVGHVKADVVGKTCRAGLAGSVDLLVGPDGTEVLVDLLSTEKWMMELVVFVVDCQMQSGTHLLPHP